MSDISVDVANCESSFIQGASLSDMDQPRSERRHPTKMNALLGPLASLKFVGRTF